MYFCTQDGYTALHIAAQEGNLDVVKLLTEAKAHVSIETKVHTQCYIFHSDIDSHIHINRGISLGSRPSPYAL